MTHDPLDAGSLTSLPGVLWASLCVRLGAGEAIRPHSDTSDWRQGRGVGTGSLTTTPIDVTQCSVYLGGPGCWGADHHREALLWTVRGPARGAPCWRGASVPGCLGGQAPGTLYIILSCRLYCTLLCRLYCTLLCRLLIVNCAEHCTLYCSLHCTVHCSVICTVHWSVQCII